MPATMAIFRQYLTSTVDIACARYSLEGQCLGNYDNWKNPDKAKPLSKKLVVLQERSNNWITFYRQCYESGRRGYPPFEISRLFKDAFNWEGDEKTGRL